MVLRAQAHEKMVNCHRNSNTMIRGKSVTVVKYCAIWLKHPLPNDMLGFIKQKYAMDAGCRTSRIPPEE